jgi:hypothetical protein
MIEYLTNPKVEILGADKFKLTEDYFIKCFDFYIVVPEGYISDLDSIPRIPVAYVALKNRAPRAAVTHDWLYSQGELSRKNCDDIFMCCMEGDGLGWSARQAMYLGVRLGGASHYNKQG